LAKNQPVFLANFSTHMTPFILAFHDTTQLNIQAFHATIHFSFSSEFATAFHQHSSQHSTTPFSSVFHDTISSQHFITPFISAFQDTIQLSIPIQTQYTMLEKLLLLLVVLLTSWIIHTSHI